MRKSFGRMFTCLVFVFLLVTFLNLVGCKKAENYTEEEHIGRISRIIEKKYLEKDVTYEIRPLYDYEDKLAYFVVDFSNDTYFYIELEEKDRSGCYGASMYVKDTTGNISNSCPWKNNDDVTYHKSHFKVAEISNDTRCYLIKLFHKNILVPAIKQGDKFINLITMKEFEYYTKEDIADSNIAFFSSAEFNL